MSTSFLLSRDKWSYHNLTLYFQFVLTHGEDKVETNGKGLRPTTDLQRLTRSDIYNMRSLSNSKQCYTIHVNKVELINHDCLPILMLVVYNAVYNACLLYAKGNDKKQGGVCCFI